MVKVQLLLLLLHFIILGGDTGQRTRQCGLLVISGAFYQPGSKQSTSRRVPSKETGGHPQPPVPKAISLKRVLTTCFGWSPAFARGVESVGFVGSQKAWSAPVIVSPV